MSSLSALGLVSLAVVLAGCGSLPDDQPGPQFPEGVRAEPIGMAGTPDREQAAALDVTGVPYEPSGQGILKTPRVSPWRIPPVATATRTRTRARSPTFTPRSIRTGSGRTIRPMGPSGSLPRAWSETTLRPTRRRGTGRTATTTSGSPITRGAGRRSTTAAGSTRPMAGDGFRVGNTPAPGPRGVPGTAPTTDTWGGPRFPDVPLAWRRRARNWYRSAGGVRLRSLGDLFASNLSGHMLGGPQVGAMGQYSRPFQSAVPVSGHGGGMYGGGRTLAHPEVAGPSPQSMHIASNQVTRPPAGNAGLVRAAQFARPSTATALGGHGPAGWTGNHGDHGMGAGAGQGSRPYGSSMGTSAYGSAYRGTESRTLGSFAGVGGGIGGPRAPLLASALPSARPRLCTVGPCTAAEATSAVTWVKAARRPPLSTTHPRTVAGITRAAAAAGVGIRVAAVGAAVVGVDVEGATVDRGARAKWRSAGTSAMDWVTCLIE